MKIALISTSVAVVLTAIITSYMLPKHQAVEEPNPYKFAMTR